VVKPRVKRVLLPRARALCCGKPLCLSRHCAVVVHPRLARGPERSVEGAAWFSAQQQQQASDPQWERIQFVDSDPVPTGLFADSSYSRTGLNLGIILVPFALQGTSGLSQRIISKDMELQSRFASTFLEGSRSARGSSLSTIYTCT